MLGEREPMDQELFVACGARDSSPEDTILRKVDRVLDPSWLRAEVGDLYCAASGRPGIDPEAAVRPSAVPSVRDRIDRSANDRHSRGPR